MMLTFTSNLAFIALVSLANLTSIASKNVRWILYGFVFVFYAGFTVVDNFLLADVMFEYKKLNQLWKGEFNLSTLKGFLSLFICLALCIFNAFMIRYSLKAK
jgi:TRAP-type mannitol/chloroaromatic compound transport system permease small subunit